MPYKSYQRTTRENREKEEEEKKERENKKQKSIKSNRKRSKLRQRYELKKKNMSLIKMWMKKIQENARIIPCKNKQHTLYRKKIKYEKMIQLSKKKKTTQIERHRTATNED